MQDALSVDLYVQIKEWLLNNDPDTHRMLAWASTVTAPTTPEALAGEIVWVQLCAGRSAQAARTIERKVRRALDAGEPVVEVFGYRAKAAAIEQVWGERAINFAAMRAVLDSGSPQAIIDWCASLPFIGDDTKYQLAKNCGVTSVCKPDIWMCRLAGIADRPRRPLRERFARCQAMAQQLAADTGDSVAVVDSLLWQAANKGLIEVTFDPHRIRFHARAPRGRSIFAAAGEVPPPPIPTPGTNLDTGPARESLS